MSDDRLLQEDAPPQPIVTPNVTQRTHTCCLCDREIIDQALVMLPTDDDPSWHACTVHAKCAHEYALAMKAFRNAAER